MARLVMLGVLLLRTLRLMMLIYYAILCGLCCSCNSRCLLLVGLRVVVWVVMHAERGGLLIH